jgi:hypothetical protein
VRPVAFYLLAFHIFSFCKRVKGIRTDFVSRNNPTPGRSLKGDPRNKGMT